MTNTELRLIALDRALQSYPFPVDNYIIKSRAEEFYKFLSIDFVEEASYIPPAAPPSPNFRNDDDVPF